MTTPPACQHCRATDRPLDLVFLVRDRQPLPRPLVLCKGCAAAAIAAHR